MNAKSAPARVIAAAVALAAINATPMSAHAQSGARAGVFNCPASGGKQEVGAVAGGVIGGLLGSSVSRDNRAIGAVIGAAVGAAAGSWIGCRLQISDREKAQAALEKALAENRDQTWSSSTARGSVELIGTTSGPGGAPAAQAIDMPRFGEGVQALPRYTHSAAGPYRARARANLRGGPGTNTAIVGALVPNEAVSVVAEAPGTNWLLVEQNGVARGYVAASLLTRTGAAQSAAGAAPQTCRLVRENVAPVGGSPQSSTVRACRGADGLWQISQV